MSRTSSSGWWGSTTPVRLADGAHTGTRPNTYLQVCSSSPDGVVGQQVWSRHAPGISTGMNNSKMDKLKGRVKEAAGDLTNSDELKKEGRTDQKAGDAKAKINDVADKARNAVDKVRDKITRH